MKLPSKLVGIEGGMFTARLRGCSGQNVILKENPLLCLAHVTHPGEDTDLCFQALKPGRDIIEITVDGMNFEIPAVIFREREFFVCLTISSNYHIGMNPETYVIGMQEDGSVPEGHGFEKVCRNLVEPHVHALGLPVTWLIDSTVAFAGQERLRQWHLRYYDDIGVMPPSYIHYNAVNYNLTMSEKELTEYLRAEITRVEEQLGWYTDVVGIDQFIGSVDNRFAAAMENLGIHGVWGMGLDHFACDTSMYHRGIPWDCFKLNASNVRIPARYPTDLWAFQWTQRDLINTLKTPTGASGSVIFSTDVDDIRSTGIMAAQPDYYHRMLADSYESFLTHPENDFGVFLMHQEDHDTGFEDNNAYWGSFLRSIDEPVTYATINEIAAWLNLKYRADEHPSQSLLVHDVLTCQDQVEWGYGGVARPDDWGAYPNHVFYYDRDVQLAAEQGKRIPCRVFDYQENIPLEFGEIYPEKELPDAAVLSESLKDGIYTAAIQSDRSCARLPLVVEYYSRDGGRHCRIVRVNLEQGEQEIRTDLGAEAAELCGK